MTQAPGPPAVTDGHPGARGRYWDDVGRHWLVRRPDTLWRRCSDAIHARWLDSVAADVRDGRVLKTDLFDEAFGDGLAAWFDRRGNRVMGCDLALSTARHAVTGGSRVRATVADVLQLPFTAASFDCVLSNSTLDHFGTEDHILRGLRELARVLRPGGTLLLTLDNASHPLVWLRNRRPGFWMRLGVVPCGVGVTCSVRRTAHLLRLAGFEVVERAAIMHAPRVLVVAACRWLFRRRGVHAPTRRWLEWLLRWERMGRWPTRYVTGHFVAVVARRVA